MYCSAASLLRSTSNLRSSFSTSTPKRCLQRTRIFCSQNKALPAPDVQKLAQLAHISVTEQQARMLENPVAANSRRVSSLHYICGAGPGLGAQDSKHSTVVFPFNFASDLQHAMQPGKARVLSAGSASSSRLMSLASNLLSVRMCKLTMSSGMMFLKSAKTGP